jgi:hypothetical protein
VNGGNWSFIGMYVIDKRMEYIEKYDLIG